MRYLLALDEGTTSARAALYDEQGRRLAMRALAVECRYPQSGWVEQDARTLLDRQLEATRALLADAGVLNKDIAGLGVTNQRESVVVWNRKSGEPLAPAINWQCRRTAAFCDELSRQAAAKTITRKTGLVIDAYFSASKLRWILENIPGVRDQAEAGEALFGTVDCWLIWNLTGGRAHVTDVTNASRTMLMNLATGAWDADLLRLFDVPKAMLPRIVPSQGVVGETDPEIFGGSIPIAGIAGDQQSALFGQACFEPGMVKNTYGTGCFALLHTGSRVPESSHQLLATRAASSGSAQALTQAFALEGSVFTAGAAVQWLRDELGLVGSAEQTGELAESVPDSNGVYCVPAFVGLGAPHWRPQARGIVVGLTRNTNRAHLVRATLESIAYQSQDLFEAMMADSREAVKELRVDGGAAKNDFLMQFQADLLGCAVVRPMDIETTALGAAYLAGLATGIFSDTAELAQLWRSGRTFEPKLPKSERDRLYGGWQEAVARA